MHRASKKVEFCYGHRVWSQSLNKEFSIDDCLMCRHLHGHQGSITVSMERPELINGMVEDFKHLNWFKQFVDDVLDHKFIIDINDPLFEQITTRTKADLIDMEHSGARFKILQLNDIDTLENELLESFIVVDFVPTSERLAQWFHEVTQNKMAKLGVTISQISFKETPKSEAVYSKEK